MAVPDYESCMLPLLNFYADSKEHTFSEAVEALAEQFKLSATERATTLSSGQQVLSNRVGWARTYMKKAGLIEAPRRGVNKITARGLDIAKKKPKIIDVKFLEQFQEFKDFRAIRSDKSGEEVRVHEVNGKTPQETLENAYEQLQNALAAEVLQQMKTCTPAFFEKLVVDVIVKMGYGGLQKDAGEVTGKSGDGGIDGIIKEDKLGLDVIPIQAKHWEGSVGRPEIQRFAGAIVGRQAKKGLFITTSSFTPDAKDYVSRIVDPKIVLIDGPALARFMIEYNVGVSGVASYELKKVDLDYFTEE